MKGPKAKSAKGPASRKRDKTRAAKKAKPGPGASAAKGVPGKRKRAHPKVEEVREEDLHDSDVDPDQDDVDFVTSLQGSSFLRQFERADFKSNPAVDRKEEEDDIIERHESKPRKGRDSEESRAKEEAPSKVRIPLLPVKNLEGAVEAAIEVVEEPASLRRRNGHHAGRESEEGPGGSGEVSKQPDVTEAKAKGTGLAKQMGKRSRAAPTPDEYPDIRRRIAVCSVSAIEKPESKGEESLGELLDYARLQDSQVCQLAMLSLQAVFKDILPSYKIKSIDESDMNLSKEVRKQHTFEAMLLRTYQSFLRILFKKNKSGMKQVKMTACKCLCKLLRANYNFNYSSDLMKQAVPMMDSKNTEVASLAMECVKELFRVDKDGEATLEILQLMADYIRRNDCTVNGGMVKVIEVIRLSDDLTRKLLQAEEDDSVHIGRKEKQRRALEKRRKRDAALAEGRDVDYHLGTASQGVKEKMKVQTKMIEGMFECIFRVLKNFKDGITEGTGDVKPDKYFSWPLLSSALSCLAKFCVYINIDFMKDLFDWLYVIASEDVVPKAQKFQCLNSVYQILDGPGKALNIDTLRFDTRLYELVLEEKYMPVGSAESEEGGSAVANAIQAALLHRRVMDRKRVINFMKRICMCSLSEACSEETLGSVHLVARLLQRYVSTRALLENDEVNSVYTYDGFEGTLDLHGRNTCPLWELSLLKRHYHPHVASSVGTIVSNNTADLLKDPSSVLNVNDVGELFKEYASRRGRFNPAPPRRPPKKAQGKRGQDLPPCALEDDDVDANAVKESLVWHSLGKRRRST